MRLVYTVDIDEEIYEISGIHVELDSIIEVLTNLEVVRSTLESDA